VPEFEDVEALLRRNTLVAVPVNENVAKVE
jgi:hypothetical protein